jgi:hypothetical protein
MPRHSSEIAALGSRRMSCGLRTLEAIARKLALPKPDAHQNQIESKPAFETVEVDSEPRDASG